MEGKLIQYTPDDALEPGANKAYWPCRPLYEIADQANAVSTAIWEATEIRERVHNPKPLHEQFDLQKLCELGKFMIVPREFDGSTGAIMKVCPDDTFTIFLDRRIRANGQILSEDPLLMRETARFFVGHEIGHSLFYERKSGHIPRPLRFPPLQEEQWQLQEYFCDVFSAGLLLPKSTLTRQEGYSNHELMTIHKQFIVPITIIHWTLADYSHDYWKTHLWDAYHTSLMEAMASLQT